MKSIVGIILWTGMLLAGQVFAAESPLRIGPEGTALARPDSSAAAERDEVARLLRELDAPQLERREAAEAALLDRGPAVLDALPPSTARLSAEVRQRLERIRGKLERRAADAFVQPSTITLRAEAMPLRKVLEALQAQSGNAIADDRREFGQPADDLPVSAEFDRTPFWPALDRVLDLGGLTLYPYSERRALCVVAAPASGGLPRSGRACYCGPFRVEPVSIAARRDLRAADGRTLALVLEAAWEPRLRVVHLTHRMADVQVFDEEGRPWPAADPDGQQETSIGEWTTAVRLELPLRPAARAAQRLAVVRGKLRAAIPGKMETFRFGDLDAARNVRRRIAGATVTLEQVRRMAGGDSLDEATWEVCTKVVYDDAGDALASHRPWMLSNPARLEAADGRVLAPAGVETTLQGRNELGVNYRFRTDRPLGEWSYVYETPGAIVSGVFEYELHNVELP